MFRKLKANEIECRVSTINKNGLSLLLYKDARCDMNILDESVGAMNWKREHARENKNCIVSIWDSNKMQWISKEDTGTESYTEKEKGLASDSFKRACFNWGIGRELYTAPFIWIKPNGYEEKQKNGKPTTYTRFKVSSIGYDQNGIINNLQIKNDNGVTVYQLGRKVEIVTPQDDGDLKEIQEEFKIACANRKLDFKETCKAMGITGNSTKEDILIALSKIGKLEKVEKF